MVSSPNSYGYGPSGGYTKRTQILTRWSQLESDRATWMPTWRQLGEQFLPRAGRFNMSDRDKGTNKHNKILDNRGLLALRVLRAGMMSGATSPARPWFRFGLPDEDLMEFQPVKEWLADAQRIVLDIFAKSNTYPMLHQTYGQLGCFGTDVVIVDDDYESVINHYNSPTGEYAIASDYKGRVNTIYREFEKTVGELVGEFGYNNCSGTVRRLHDAGTLNATVPVLHVIEPRVDRDPKMRDSKNKRWKSCYLETGREDMGDRYLRESGYDRFPGMCPRWDRRGGDVYGTSPGMDAIGDSRQLQHQQLRKANAIDFQSMPPLQAPTALRGQDTRMLPGGIWYVDAPHASNAVKTLFDVNLNLEHLREDIQDVRERINEAFYVPLFLMLANLDKTGITATEVAERHEEKLVQLGPVIESLHGERLAPTVEGTFERVLQHGLLPPAPKEIRDMDMNVQFISTLAQAQRAVGVNSVDRFVVNLGAIAQFKPDVLDKFNADKWADNYSDMMGVDPEMINSDEDVAKVRAVRARQQAAAAQAEQAKVQSEAARNLGAVPTGGAPNLANDVISQFSGYSAPSGAGPGV